MAQVKMDRIRFAQLMVWLAVRTGYNFGIDECADIDSVLIFEVPESTIEPAKVDELLKQFSAVDGFIPAIKAYRALTGEGLKEAKEAIERYRPSYTNGLEQFKKRAIEKIAGEDISTEYFNVIRNFLEKLT